MSIFVIILLKKLICLKRILSQLHRKIKRRDHYEKEENRNKYVNYFDEGIIVMCFGVRVLVYGRCGVNAMEHGINIDRTGNVELIPLTQKDDGTLNYLNVTNSTGKAIKVTFEDTTPSTAYKKGDIWVGNHRYQWGNSVRNFIYMYPGQSIKRACKVEFGVYDRKAETSITVKAEVLSKAQYIKNERAVLCLYKIQSIRNSIIRYAVQSL